MGEQWRVLEQLIDPRIDPLWRPLRLPRVMKVLQPVQESLLGVPS
jgi:hypothetical protein